MRLRAFIILVLVLNSACSTTATHNLEGYDKREYKKAIRTLDKFCEKESNEKKPTCVHYRFTELEKEGHTHTPIWITIFAPYAVGVLFTLLLALSR